MKRSFGKQAVIILAAVLLAVWVILPASAEQTVWNCPQCGRMGNTGNYCGGCAQPAPWTEAPPADDTPAASGAIISELGVVPTLNIEDRASGAVYHFTYDGASAERPTDGSGHGYMYINSDSPNYGVQIIYSNTGIFTRQLIAGGYTEWVDALGLPASCTVVTELGSIKSLNIEDRARGAIYHFTCDSSVEEGNPTKGSGQGYLFVNTDNANFGRQFFISDRGIYSRTLNQGKYGNWKTIVY